ncbi:expansin-A23-like [Carica papaya]|uniref:expansin-A23-like n=1 Tax=Carica papaya TaxID=3649 RepID=UPI000B8CF730|nr:expansin-A23-like [Carica papaya]
MDSMARHVSFFMAILVFMGLAACGGGNDHTGWRDAHATFYGDLGGGETMQGACGYENLFEQGYGLETAALSSVLFREGAMCGACFEIMCVNDPKWCIKGADPIRVTATNFCPPNYTKSEGNWCNPPLEHFDLTLKMFLRIAKYKAGIVPVKYRRVLCYKQGGVHFVIKGNSYWILVLVYNVARSGVVSAVQIKGSNTNWMPMSRNWGMNWHTFSRLAGQSLSFRVTTSDGKMLQFNNLVPANWQFNSVYDGKKNF